MATNDMSFLNRVYTRSMLQHFIKGEVDSAYSSVVSRLVDNADSMCNRDIIRVIYDYLKRGYRNEYYYKNTLLNKLLLGVHNTNSSTALTEVPIAKSKADFVIINGRAVVYEIKTELDNLDRLSSQIDDYYKAFDNVVVVTYENNLSHIQRVLESFNKPVGIYLLRKNGCIGRAVEPSPFTDDLDGEVLFRLLRKAEYEEIILNEYSCLPRVTQFNYYSACKALFLNIPIEKEFSLVKCVLKKRKAIQKDEFAGIPYELKFLAYFSNMKKDDYMKLNDFLDSQYGGA